MKVIRITDPDEIKPLHVVMVCLVAATLAGSCLLTSGPYRQMLHDGAVEWGADSPLRAVVQVLNLQFTQTTSKGVEIKALVFGIGSALAMLTLAFALGIRPRAGDAVSEEDTTVISADQTEAGASVKKKQITPLVAAQFLMLAFALWALASPLWSGTQRQYALGGAIVLAVQLMWAFGLGLGLNRVTARASAYALVIVSVLTALLAISYHDQRNPTLRASYPIGNPLFLAACLVPGLLVAAGVVIGSIQSYRQRRDWGRLAAAVAALLALTPMLWAFYLADSRGPAIGLVAGAGGMVLFALRGRVRLVAGLVLVVVVGAAGAYFFAQRHAYSDTGRSQTLRLRLFAWQYALDLGSETALLGGGPGAFVLAGDAFAARTDGELAGAGAQSEAAKGAIVPGDDVLADPLALDARLAHAHNEWLEIWCELGSVGLVLLGAALLMTFLAGAGAVDRMPTPTLRWTLIALLAALLGLIVEESGNVGLRLPGLPTVYFTVIGLIWAMSVLAQPRWMSAVQATLPTRALAFVLAAALAVGALVASLRDFQASRAFAEVPAALARTEWDEALSLAHQARDKALDPQRRLDATDRLCAAYLQCAREHQREAFRLQREAQQVDPPDARRLALASHSEERSMHFVQEGLAELKTLLQDSPASWNSGVLEHGFWRVLAEFAGAQGKTDEMRQHMDTAITALEREICRRPFNPDLAVNYAALTMPPQYLAPWMDVMARPLRHKLVPLEYLELLGELATSTGFDNRFGDIYRTARSVAPETPVEQWADPWAPEKLRLAAIVRFTRGMHPLAEEELTHAAQLYDVIRDEAPIGAASCNAELADAQFYANPDVAGRALQTAARAIEMCPRSEAGRELRDAVRDRTITYYLAAGQEEDARSVFGEVFPEARDQDVDANLGARYWHLAHSGEWRSLPAAPRRFTKWVERAIALHPSYELHFKEDEMVRVLRGALRLGADLNVIRDFLDYLQQQRPDSTLLPQLRAWIDQVVSPPPAGAPATQPATTQPSTG